jgi:segregation and condensation protein B
MELKFILESLLFASQKPLTPRELREALAGAVEHAEEAKPFKKVKEEQILPLLEELERDYNQAGRSYRLVCVAGAWQFASLPEYAPWLRALVGAKVRPPKLSQPALETLAIVAYRQPLTRAEIEQIRGVSVDGVVQTLLERGLIETVGRAEVVGRPMTYGTTPLFLEYFGLRNLEELPAADELRRIVVQKPETLLTVEPGLATAPPDQLQTAASNGAAASNPSDVQSTSPSAPEEHVPRTDLSRAAPESEGR